MEEMKKRGQEIISIILFIIALGIFIFIFVIYKSESSLDKDNINNGAIEREICSSDAECVPASCCHATSCVSVKNKPDCSGIFCTASCEPGTLDCSQGSCKCIDSKCKVELK